ncbi:MAG: protein translocase subunit SecD [Acidimicrobiia bacterium]|nr:protein translocase subunit SecD [Acidimicrobiia bacterium]
MSAAFIASLATGQRPLLGIDLTGGVEVVLEPVLTDERPDGPTEPELDQTVEILRNRVDALDVAQPDITRQGSLVVVQLPDVDDQQRAIEIVGTTAELQFRPVCSVLPVALDVDDAIDQGLIDPDALESDDGTDEEGLGFAGEGEYAAPAIPLQEDEPTPEPGADETPEPDAEAPVVDDETPGAVFSDAFVPPSACDADSLELVAEETTASEDIRRDEPVLLDQRDENGLVVQRYYLGPVPSAEIEGEDVFLVGTAVESADAFTNGLEWTVSLVMEPGDGGIGLFNDIAAECFASSAVCPSGQLAIVLDGTVESAPNINAPAFDRSNISISGAFSQSRAEDTALVLQYGSLPIELEQQRIRTVSASLGSDSLRAGIISGIIGLLLVAVYMTAYYRILGVAALLSLFVSGAMLWVLVSFFSETGFFFGGVTLTIAGVVGLIVSLGVSLDSNVIYFEHLKEDIANGRTLRSAVDRSFPVAYRTIFWADMAALIGAVVLYLLTISSVREFAFMLGLASVLDLVATYFFLRPLVKLISRTDIAVERPGLLGLPASVRRARA